MRLVLVVILEISLLSNYLFASTVPKKNFITIAYAQNWKPYSYKDKNAKMQGILVEIVDKLLRDKLKMRVDHVGLPWKRAQKSVSTGLMDALITVPTIDRLKYSQSTTNDLYNLKWRIFVSKRSKKFSKIMSMKDPLDSEKFTYISLLGDKTSENLYKQKNKKYSLVKNINNAIKMLAIGRADIFIHSQMVMTENLNNLKLDDDVKMHPKEYVKIPFTLLISKKSKYRDSLTKKVDEIVNDMKKNNEYKSLIKEIENSNVN